MKVNTFLSTYYVKALVWFVSLLAFMIFTNPMKVPVLILVVPLALFSFGMYYIFRFLLQVVGLSRTEENQRVIAGIATIVCSGAIGLQSIGQLTPLDFLVLTLLAIFAYFYIARNTLGSS